MLTVCASHVCALIGVCYKITNGYTKLCVNSTNKENNENNQTEQQINEKRHNETGQASTRISLLNPLRIVEMFGMTRKVILGQFSQFFFVPFPIFNRRACPTSRKNR